MPLAMSVLRPGALCLVAVSACNAVCGVKQLSNFRLKSMPIIVVIGKQCYHAHTQNMFTKLTEQILRHS